MNTDKHSSFFSPRRARQLLSRYARLARRPSGVFLLSALSLARSFGQEAIIPATPAPAISAPQPPPVIVPATPVPPPDPPSFYAAPPEPYTPLLPDEGVDSFYNPGFVQQFIDDPLQWGPFRVSLSAAYRFTYATGVLRRPGQIEDTARHSITPGITLQSQHVTLNYTPSLRYYTKGSYRDSLNHNASIAARYGYGDWRFGLSHRYSTGTSAFVETGGQNGFQRHSTGLSATWLYSDRTSFRFGLAQRISDNDRFNSSITWSTMNWINYRLTERTIVGAGAGAGYTDVETGADMTYEQFQGRISWRPRPKIGFSANGGVEIRQFAGEEARGDQVNPVMGVSAVYHPFDYTSLYIAANHGIGSSVFSHQITERTTISAGLSQRLLEHFNFSISGGFRYTDYQSTSRVVNVNRSDESHFITTSLSTGFLKKGRVGISYTRNENESNLERYEFASNQYTFSISYRL